MDRYSSDQPLSGGSGFEEKKDEDQVGETFEGKKDETLIGSPQSPSIIDRVKIHQKDQSGEVFEEKKDETLVESSGSLSSPQSVIDQTKIKPKGQSNYRLKYLSKYYMLPRSAADPGIDIDCDIDEASDDELDCPTTCAPLTWGDHDDKATPKKKKYSKSSSSLSLKRTRRQYFGTILRTIIVDLPFVLLFALYASTLFFERITDEYLLPQLKLARFTQTNRGESELMYYNYECTNDDITAADPRPLVITPDMSAEDCVDHMNTHGAQVHPNLLSAETAREVREFILEQNMKGKDMIDVLENTNRWSFGITPDQHPSVVKALKEILSKPQLVGALEAIAGKDPAIIEFTGITSAYGATTQHYHQDVVPSGNGAKYGRNFIPSYSLFIPLQNTTKAMGATDICPGTHMCADGANDVCETKGFDVAGPSDNWPMGYGALLNQQTTHRGAAHSDPTAPHRAVFILTFAPRPNFERGLVETRQIGQGGSYSLHWSNWGHTLSDYQDPLRHMAQPWRTLRSMGLYKAPGRNWGWDYGSQMNIRVSNGELGFYPKDLKKFLKSGGFSFLPTEWQTKFKTDKKDKKSNLVWKDFLVNLLTRCQDEFNAAYRKALGLYVGCLLLVNALLVVSGRRKLRDSTFLRGIARLICLHLPVLLFFWLYLRHVSEGSWARNIKAGRLYQLPYRNIKTSELKATLPNRNDVMVFDDMQSEYLAAYNRVFDAFHPGNVAWNKVVAQNSVNYENLPLQMQKQLASDLPQWMKQERRRLLIRNPNGNWAELSKDDAKILSHKALLKGTNPVLDIIIRQNDFLLAETKYGYWRGTALHLKHIPAFLKQFQSKLLCLDNINDAGNPTAVTMEHTMPRKSYLSTPHLSPLGNVPQMERPAHLLRSKRRMGIPKQPEIAYPAFWAKEGDLIEANYLETTGEWYRAHIVEASANNGRWTVLYEDGEEDDYLCQECVRPWVKYRIDEVIEVRMKDDGQFHRGKVVKVNPDDTFDLVMEDGGQHNSNVSYTDLRRSNKVQSTELNVGTRVLARFQGGQQRFAGVITKMQRDGTFDILYDDGDFEEHVQRKFVVPEPEMDSPL